MIALANRLIETDDIATQWEAYYVAKGGTRATRRFIRRMSEELDVEVCVFVDCDSMVYVTFTARSRSALAMWHTSTMRSACLRRDI